MSFHKIQIWFYRGKKYDNAIEEDKFEEQGRIMVMRIALYQMNIEWENKEINYFHVMEAISKAAQEDIKLFLLPEMSFTGFSMNTALTKEKNAETIRRMAECAKKYQIAIGFGWVKDCGVKSENHYTVIDKEGNILSDYAKIHPFSYAGESEKFKGGEKITVFAMNGMNIATFICYDLRFPEIFQIASKQADVILVPANWPETRAEHWKCLLQARAIENQVYIVGINCVGTIHGLHYSGDSCVIDPNGKILQEISEKEGILAFELKNDVQEIRDGFPVKRDRREELYCVLN